MPITSPIFPAEIFIDILRYVNDLELWAVRRQVSRMMRKEAEREFARSRLCNLVINIYARIEHGMDEDQFISYNVVTTGLKHVKDGCTTFQYERLVDETTLNTPLNADEEHFIGSTCSRATSTQISTMNYEQGTNLAAQ